MIVEIEPKYFYIPLSFFSRGSCCSCTMKSCFIKSVLILSRLMGGTLRWCCVFFFKLLEGKKNLPDLVPVSQK